MSYEHDSRFAKLHVSIAAARDEQRLGLPHRAARLTHSWNSYMSPCPPSRVKPRAGSQPRRYPNAPASHSCPASGQGCCGAPRRGDARGHRCRAAMRRPPASPHSGACGCPETSARRLLPGDFCPARPAAAAGGPRAPASRFIAEVRGSRHCRRLPLRRVLQPLTGRDMHRPWRGVVRIVSAVRALHRA
jgi:hypothetical protein